MRERKRKREKCSSTLVDFPLTPLGILPLLFPFAVVFVLPPPLERQTEKYSHTLRLDLYISRPPHCVLCARVCQSRGRLAQREREKYICSSSASLHTPSSQAIALSHRSHCNFCCAFPPPPTHKTSLLCLCSVHPQPSSLRFHTSSLRFSSSHKFVRTSFQVRCFVFNKLVASQSSLHKFAPSQASSFMRALAGGLYGFLNGWLYLWCLGLCGCKCLCICFARAAF